MKVLILCQGHAGKTNVLTVENISALNYGLLGAFLQQIGGSMILRTLYALFDLSRDSAFDLDSRLLSLFDCSLTVGFSLIPLIREALCDVGNGLVSKRKFCDRCHREGCVRIPLEDDRLLRFNGECTQGVREKPNEHKEDSEDPHEREVDFRIDLVQDRRQSRSLRYRLAPTRKQDLSEQPSESRKDKVSDALVRKERVKSRRVRGMILTAQSCSNVKQENIWVLLVGSVMDEAHASRLRWMNLTSRFFGGKNAAESVREAMDLSTVLASQAGFSEEVVIFCLRVRSLLCLFVKGAYGCILGSVWMHP
ncbi:hypothetical protein Tco_0832830, partial [Tanacetum coccineum]